MTTRPSTAPALTPAAQFSAFLSRFPAATIALVKRCLPKIRGAVPCTHEVVYNYSHAVVVSFGMSERGYEAIVALSIESDRLRLYFDKSLPDPQGLLEGKGGKVRSVTIKTASDLDHADIQALFKAANRNAGGPFLPSKTGTTLMIIKSASSSKKTNSKKATKKAKKKTSKKTSK